jgi:tetratricopeptide (TPR) repeat protein
MTLRKKAGLLAWVIILSWACVTTAPPPPSLYIESPAPELSARLSLDERITVEDAWNNLKQGRAAKAEKILAKLGSANPFYDTGLGYAALLVDNLPLAEQHFQQTVREHPEMTLARLGLGQLYQKAGKEEQAYNEYIEVLKRDPENGWALKESDAIRVKKTAELLKAGKAYAEAGNKEKGKESYLEALHYSPKSQEAHLALARLYREEASYQNALFHLRTANANDPKNKNILRDYADTLYLAEQFPRSLDIYERLLELDPQSKPVKDRIETLKNKLGIIELPSQFNNIGSSEAVTKEDMAALIGIKLRDALGETSPKPPVMVDITTSWASRFILKTTALEIMDVYSNHTFQPKKIMTRAEIAEVLVRLVNVLKKNGYKIIEQLPIERIQILDVPQDHFSFQAIAQVLSYQLMTLTPDRTFKPELSLSGQEAIKTLDIILGLIK